MIRFCVRAIALLILAGAFVALVLDGTRSIAAGGLTLQSFGTLLQAVFPQKYPGFQPWIETHLHPLVWDPVLTFLLALPTFLILALVGAALLRLTRRRPAPIGYTSRP